MKETMRMGSAGKVGEVGSGRRMRAMGDIEAGNRRSPESSPTLGPLYSVPSMVMLDT